MGKIVFFVFALAATTFGQSRWGTGPVPAATGPAFAVGAGYTYIAMPVPSAGHVNLNGLDVSGHSDMSSRWGATVDTSYVRATNVLGTGHNSYILSLLAGPVFYPVAGKNSRMFVHVLAGVGLVDGAVPIGFGVPRVKALAQALAFGLDGEVDDGGRPPEGRRSRARLEGVG